MKTERRRNPQVLVWTCSHGLKAMEKRAKRPWTVLGKTREPIYHLQLADHKKDQTKYHHTIEDDQGPGANEFASWMIPKHAPQNTSLVAEDRPSPTRTLSDATERGLGIGTGRR